MQVAVAAARRHHSTAAAALATATGGPRASRLPRDGKGLQDFLHRPAPLTSGSPGDAVVAASRPAPTDGGARLYFLETYGCQMNSADSEIVHAVLKQAGHSPVDDITKASIILVRKREIRQSRKVDRPRGDG
jgi:hypothetical protein